MCMKTMLLRTSIQALLLAGCGAADCPPGSSRLSDGLCHLPDEVGDSGQGDTGQSCGEDIPLGDPILTLAQSQADSFMEYLDAAPITTERGILVANNGFVIVDLTSGQIIHEDSGSTGFRVAYDPTTSLAWIGTRWSSVLKVDLSDPDNPTRLGGLSTWEGYHEDVAVEDGLLVVAAQESGAIFFEDDIEVGRAALEYWCSVTSPAPSSRWAWAPGMTTPWWQTGSAAPCWSGCQGSRGRNWSPRSRCG